jgi:hypothetical protein
MGGLPRTRPAAFKRRVPIQSKPFDSASRAQMAISEGWEEKRSTAWMCKHRSQLKRFVELERNSWSHANSDRCGHRA